jgi:hypothetical protein
MPAISADFLIGDSISLSENFTSSNAVSPGLAYNSLNKEYAAVWDFRENEGRGLAFQRFSSEGDLIERNLKIPEDGNFVGLTDLTYNSVENQYLLSYWNNLPDSNPGLFGQLLAADGTPVGNNLLLSNSRFDPSFVYNSNQNEYFQTSRRYPGEAGIFGQRINSDGFLIGSAIRIDSVGDSAPNGEVAFNSIDNQYLATWRNQSNNIDSVVGRLISADGSFLSEQFDIVKEAELASSINPVFDSINTQFLVVYGFDTANIKAQIVDADGTVIGDEIVISDDSYNVIGDEAISVAFSQELGIYLLVARTNLGLLGQFISDSGSLIDDPFVISSRKTSGNSVVYNPDESQFVVAWNFNVSDEGIFAQLISPPITQPPSTTVPEPTSILSLLVVGTVVGTTFKRNQA